MILCAALEYSAQMVKARRGSNHGKPSKINYKADAIQIIQTGQIMGIKTTIKKIKDHGKADKKPS